MSLLRIRSEYPTGRRDCGFSLIEGMIVVMILAVIGGIGAISMQGIRGRMRADAVGTQVLGLMREVRERAVAERRNYRIQFSGNDQVQITRMNVPSGSTVMKTEQLLHGAQFTVFSEIPDTPDAFGNSSAVSFGGSSILNFLSDGTLVDSTGAPLNGTLFVGTPNNPSSAQAVTVLGSTGRVQLYRWSRNRWIR